jgi:hypothetical protein
MESGMMGLFKLLNKPNITTKPITFCLIKLKLLALRKIKKQVRRMIHNQRCCWEDTTSASNATVLYKSTKLMEETGKEQPSKGKKGAVQPPEKPVKKNFPKMITECIFPVE